MSQTAVENGKPHETEPTCERSTQTRGENQVSDHTFDIGPMLCCNHITGKRQRVLYLAPNELLRQIDQGLIKSAQIPANSELKIDLKRALARFSPYENRILFRVLVQGLSVEQATKGSKRSESKWREWLNNTALPQLREDLKAYTTTREGRTVVERLN